eukprot:TRINITY_DN6945_c0_g1_i3.p1 TRINITY_DN6945_c0_g1~~TRINITY_DN6945_c0_g1_i3.p1  ORF type:complete len:348 (-),score=81.31 TRINITY_DN6945_c0_g1_i3:163-1206(-)
MIGVYRVEEEIGKGMFGIVYKGIHSQTGLTVAIKQIDLSVLDKTKLPLVTREAEVMESLSHDNIVKLYAVISSADKKSLYFVLEFVDCGSLFKLLKNYGIFPQDISSMCIRQCLEGLAYLHCKNIVHRDIKCDNLLINSTGIIKLADFGTAKAEDQNKSFTVVGTPFWMAPEVIEMTGGSTISDIWSLGCTLLELLTGEPPYFKLGSMQALFNIVEDDHPPLPNFILNDPELSHFLLTCCFQKNPKLRPSASDLLKQEWILKYKKLSLIPFEELKRLIKKYNKIEEEDDDDDKKLPKHLRRQKQVWTIPTNPTTEDLENLLEEVTKERDVIKNENVELKKVIEQSLK